MGPEAEGEVRAGPVYLPPEVCARRVLRLRACAARWVDVEREFYEM